MKVLVTGAGGQVGREIVELAAANIDIIACTSSELDISNPAQVNRTLESQRPNVVINAAAYTAVDKAEDEPDKAYAVNRDGVANMARACKTLDIPLLHISTDYVFDGTQDTPYTEIDEPNPINVYGASKLAGELALQEIWEKHIILRVSWVFGKYGNNFVKTILRLARERDELSIVDDQIGGPTEAAHLAQTLLQLACLSDECTGKILHLQAKPATSWYGFAREILQQSKLLDNIVLNAISSDEYPQRASRPKNSVITSHADSSELTVPDCHWPSALRQVLARLND